MKGRLPMMILGLVLIAIGALWSLQGAGVVGGSVMTGRPQWIVIGLPVALIGLLLVVRGVAAGRQGRRRL